MTPSDDPFALLGWAGLLLPVPSEFRLARITGDDRRGSVSLCDDDRIRLEMTWGEVTRKRFNARKTLEKRLGARSAATVYDDVTNPHWSLMLGLTTEESIRVAGFCEKTQRVVDLAYHKGTAAQDRDVRRRTLTQIRDQPIDQPTQWSFFNVQFSTPPWLVYQKATLNLGDMHVRLGTWDKRQELTVRAIYPAKLALARQSPQEWAHALLVREDMYRPVCKGHFRYKTLITSSRETPAGDALTCEAKIRLITRMTRWRLPRNMRMWLIYQEEANRMMVLTASGTPEQIEENLQHVAQSLANPVQE